MIALFYYNIYYTSDAHRKNISQNGLKILRLAFKPKHKAIICYIYTNNITKIF